MVLLCRGTVLVLIACGLLHSIRAAIAWYQTGAAETAFQLYQKDTPILCQFQYISWIWGYFSTSFAWSCLRCSQNYTERFLFPQLMCSKALPPGGFVRLSLEIFTSRNKRGQLTSSKERPWSAPSPTIPIPHPFPGGSASLPSLCSCLKVQISLLQPITLLCFGLLHLPCPSAAMSWSGAVLLGSNMGQVGPLSSAGCRSGSHPGVSCMLVLHPPPSVLFSVSGKPQHSVCLKGHCCGAGCWLCTDKWLLGQIKGHHTIHDSGQQQLSRKGQKSTASSELSPESSASLWVPQALRDIYCFALKGSTAV